MKKKLLKAFIFMLLVLPCTIVFGACKNDEPPAAKVSSISIELLGDGVGALAVVLILLQKLLDLVVQVVMPLLAIVKQLAHLLAFGIVQHLLDGGDTHLHPRIAFSQ